MISLQMQNKLTRYLLWGATYESRKANSQTAAMAGLAV